MPITMFGIDGNNTPTVKFTLISDAKSNSVIVTFDFMCYSPIIYTYYLYIIYIFITMSIDILVN